MSITRICKIENCASIGRYDKNRGKHYLRLGYCGKHYLRHWRGQSISSSAKDHRPSIVEGLIARVPLGLNGRLGYAIVDRSFSWVDKYNWHILSGHAYSKTFDRQGIFMHQLILGKADKGLEIDHIDGDPLNNRITNLRYTTHRQNIMNQKMHKSNTSGYKGIYKRTTKKGIKWLAKLNNDKQQIHGGTFDTKEEAARRYDELAIEYFGEYAYLNFPK